MNVTGSREAFQEAFRQEANVRFMFKAMADEFAQAIASGRGHKWCEVVRSYVGLVESGLPPIEKREDQP